MSCCMKEVMWLPKLGDLKRRMGCDTLVLTDDAAVYDRAKELDMAVAFVEAPNANSAPQDCKYVVQADSKDELDDEELERIFRRCKNIPWDILETERTYVREFTMEDMEGLFDLYAQPHMTDYMEPLFDREAEEEYQEKYIQHIYGFYGYGMWLVFDKETNRLIGRAGLETREICENNQLELGYMLHPDFQHKGVAYEVCKAIMDYGFEYIGADSIVAKISPENGASIRLIEKLGFVPVSEFPDGDVRFVTSGTLLL